MAALAGMVERQPASPQSPTSVTLPSTSSSESARGERIAPELMEILVEEIDEEISSARDRLARWSQDAQDEPALNALKHNFGVIKASASIVGARRVAEVAGVVEDILSPGAAESARDPQVTSFIAEVLDQLPVLVHAESPDRVTIADALIARARELICAVSYPGGDLDAVSAWVQLAGEDAALEVPIEDLLDVFEPEPESAEAWVLAAFAPGASESDPDSAATLMVPEDSLVSSEQALGAELERAFSAPVDPHGASDAMAEPTGSSPARVPEMRPLDRLIDRIAEMGCCRAELDVADAHWIAGLDALDQGLARLRALMDRASVGRVEGSRLAVSSGGPSGTAERDPSAEWPALYGRVVEILDDLESVRAGLSADRDASDAPRIRLGNLLQAASDVLLQMHVNSGDA
jgi:hypothetical protein